MPSLLVVQGVLSTIESDAVELGLVSLNAEGHCLLPNSSAWRGRGGVLETTKFIISIIKFKMLQEVSRIIFVRKLSWELHYTSESVWPTLLFTIDPQEWTRYLSRGQWMTSERGKFLHLLELVIGYNRTLI